MDTVSESKIVAKKFKQRPRHGRTEGAKAKRSRFESRNKQLLEGWREGEVCSSNYIIISEHEHSFWKQIIKFAF